MFLRGQSSYRLENVHKFWENRSHCSPQPEQFLYNWFRMNYSGAGWSVSGTWDSEENVIRKKGICLISYGGNLLINPHWQTFKLFSLIVFMYFLSFFHIISWGYIFRNNYHHHHITIITVGQQVWVYYGLEHRMVWSTPVFICIWGYILFSKFCYS